MGERIVQAPKVNSWLASLLFAAQTLDSQIGWQTIYAASGLPFLFVAAESWFDPATIYGHPRMQSTLGQSFMELRQLDAPLWAASGLAATQYWLATPQEFALFLADTSESQVIVSGVQGPEYGVVITHSPVTFTVRRANSSIHTLHYDEILARGGIDIVVLTTSTVIPQQRYTLLAHAVKLLALQLVVRFETPKHPLRPDQAWHIGLGAFEIMALAADHAAPLALVSTHVATITRDLWQRCDAAQQLLRVWADLHPCSEGKQLLLQAAEGFIDAQFFCNIVCTHIPATVQLRALNLAEGDLIAAACRDMRLVLLASRTCMLQALILWQTHCDAL